jgi:hypothetical protein
LTAFTDSAAFFAEVNCGNKMNDRLTELHDWLAPIKQLPVIQSDTETITELVGQLRQYSEEVTDLPKGIITVLRILQHLAIAPVSPDDSGEVALLSSALTYVRM